MLKCPSCGKAISEYATTCPNCGADLKNGDKVIKTEKAITIQRQEQKSKSRNIVINIAILSAIGLLAIVIKQYIFMNGLSAGIDLLLYLIAVMYSIVNIIRFKMLSDKSFSTIIIAIVLGVAATIIGYMLYKPVNYGLYSLRMGSEPDSFVKAAVENTVFKAAAIFHGLVWGILLIEICCFVKDKRK